MGGGCRGGDPRALGGPRPHWLKGAGGGGVVGWEAGEGEKDRSNCFFGLS